MIKLEDLSLFDLIPGNISDNAEITAMVNAIDRELKSITACINEIVLLPRIDELPEDIVDLLAWQLHVDFYEPLGLDLDKKRALVKNSLSWHRRKGTKSVLVEIIRILFFEDFDIKEWFEYEGRPYFFKLITNDVISDRQMYDNLIRAIFELKNVRSWLERIVTLHETTVTIHTGMAGKTVARTGINTADMQHPKAATELYTGIAGKTVTRSMVAAEDMRRGNAKRGIYAGIAGKTVIRSIVLCGSGR